MQSENPLFADLAKMVNSAGATLTGMAREARETGREQLREAFGGLDFVSREEFEAVKGMAAKARAEVEALVARVAVLEAANGTTAGAPPAVKPAKRGSPTS